MSPTRNAGYPEPGKTTVYDTTRSIDLDTVPLNGGVLLKVTYLSIDPYMRNKMGAPQEGKWAAPQFTLGQPLDNFGLGRVIRSDDSNFKPGDYVYGFLKFEEYVVTSSAGLEKLDNQAHIPWSAYLSAAGMPGQTAYFGYKEFVKAKKGQTIWITTGAGAVGSILIQLAKRDGLRVIGSAGSEEKVAFMKEIGADVAFNYKTTNIDDLLEKEGPIDIYWDHVGRESLDIALGHINKYGRIIIAGAISGYNFGHTYAYQNLFNIDQRSLTVTGFNVTDPELAEHWGEAFAREVPVLIARGDLKHREEKTPFELAGDALVRVLKGQNTGKSILVVSESG
ncbi:NAD(P)-binding protein [Cylindrobasidium torrendii FP15055 ss-10]|uniref:NAD(P)-binding protein n=1 Tax=Cylindrobasidium torrendii FP15055 ss-10 TaxID=1314674 RepID=A0A0D7BB72_9AGAR|nr:NAD(P)-binding protein [Cylindrobasidium torrendii FP15055 ss-10]